MEIRKKLQLIAMRILNARAESAPPSVKATHEWPVSREAKMSGILILVVSRRV